MKLCMVKEWVHSAPPPHPHHHHQDRCGLATLQAVPQVLEVVPTCTTHHHQPPTPPADNPLLPIPGEEPPTRTTAIFSHITLLLADVHSTCCHPTLCTTPTGNTHLPNIDTSSVSILLLV